MKDDKKTKKQLIHELEAEITGHRQADEALRETTDYFDGLLSHANAPIIVWNPGFRIIRFNHAFERLSGYTAAEVVGQELHMFFPEASRVELLSKIARTTSGEYRESVEIPILRKDGAVRIILWNSANILAKNGTILLATMAQGTDITERKQAEEALRQSEERFRILFEQAADCILQLEITPEGMPVIRDANNATFRLLGYERDELIGQPVSFIEVTPDASEVVDERRQNVLSGKGTIIRDKAPVQGRHDPGFRVLGDGDANRFEDSCHVGRARHHRAQAGRGKADEDLGGLRALQ